MAWIIAAAAIGGAMLSSDAAGNAADTGAAASRESSANALQANRENIALQSQIYNQQLANQRPWLNSGATALNQLMLELGMTPGEGFGAPARGITVPTAQQQAVAGAAPQQQPLPAQQAGQQSRQWPYTQDLSGAPAAGQAGQAGPQNPNAGAPPGQGAYMRGSWADPNTTVSTVNPQTGQTSYANGLGQPVTPAGVTPAPQGPEVLGVDRSRAGALAAPFNQNAFMNDAGLQFRLSQGQQALDRQAAARGGFFSGATLREGQRYAQGVASDEFNNAYNRFANERGFRTNALQSLAGIGQSSANQIGQAGQSFGNQANMSNLTTANNVGNNMINAGNWQAAGQMGQSNAWNNALSQGVNAYTQQNALSRTQQTPTYQPSQNSSPGSYLGGY